MRLMPSPRPPHPHGNRFGDQFRQWPRGKKRPIISSSVTRRCAPIKRNRRTNTQFSRAKRPSGERTEGLAFVKTRISRSASAAISRQREAGDRLRKRRLSRIGERPRIVIFTTSARQKKRLFDMVRCAAMTVVRVKLVTMLPRRRPLRIDRSYG